MGFQAIYCPYECPVNTIKNRNITEYQAIPELQAFLKFLPLLSDFKLYSLKMPLYSYSDVLVSYLHQ